jgi:hypothetical protein
MSGFDCDDYYLEHCYMVRVPRAVTEPVSFFEIFGRRPAATEQEWAPEFVLRAVLPREKWDVVSAETRLEFNRRLKAERKRSGKWIVGNNGVQRLLGKELLVLVWAVEQDDVKEDRVQVAVRNWLGLKPEERWWLYTMTAAATGYASQKGLGWRGALRHALTYGTDKDAFSFANIGERGTLPPHYNDGFTRKNDHQTRTAETAAFKAILGRLAFA